MSDHSPRILLVDDEQSIQSPFTPPTTPRAMAGRLSVDSEPGNTVFRLELPA